MPFSPQLIQSILKRNNFLLEEEGETTRMLKGSSSKNNFYLIFGVLSIIGLLVLVYFGSILFMIILLSSSVPMYVNASKVKDVEETANSGIVIRPGNISILYPEGDEVLLERGKAEHLRIYVEKNEDISIGHIFFEYEDGEQDRLIEFYSENVRYLKDDIEKVTQYIEARLEEA